MPASFWCSRCMNCQSRSLVDIEPVFGNLVANVGTVDAGDEARRLLEVQLACNLFAGHRIGGCSQRDAWHLGEAGMQRAQLAILGPEVVAPLRNAVGLIDRKERYPAPIEKRQRAFLQQALGRHIKKLQFAGSKLPLDVALRVQVERRVQEPGLDTDLVESADLVLHQGNEGRNDDCGGRGGSGPGSDSTAICRRRSASKPAHHRRRLPSRRYRPAAGERICSRIRARECNARRSSGRDRLRQTFHRRVDDAAITKP